MERLGGEIFFGCCFDSRHAKEKPPGVNQGALIERLPNYWDEADFDSELCQMRDICRAAM
jgi:hypothetical protein